MPRFAGSTFDLLTSDSDLSESHRRAAWQCPLYPDSVLLRVGCPSRSVSLTPPAERSESAPARVRVRVCDEGATPYLHFWARGFLNLPGASSGPRLCTALHRDGQAGANGANWSLLKLDFHSQFIKSTEVLMLVSQHG